MHRLGDGTKVEDIVAATQEWIANGRSPSTFPNKGEWDNWQEDLGVLLHTYEDGTEIRRHASLKCHSRGGARKIVHNRVIVGNPKKYAEWKANGSQGWMAEWTFYADSKTKEPGWPNNV